jgi:cytochrome c-type biogenesis protein CcmH
MIRALAAVILAVMFAGTAVAVLPQERLDDPALEARAREISRELRCQVCQNQSIDDSNAPLAGDLRRLVRERIKAGDTNEQVFAYLTQRYGDYILLRPPLRGDTLVLWFGPAAALLLAVIGIGLYMRRQRNSPVAAPLTADEERRLAEMLNKERGPS